MLRAAHRYSTSLPVAFLPEAEHGSAVNISTSGMFVRTGASFQRGSVLDVAVAFPDGDPPAPAKAKVVYVEAMGGATGLGMQFIEDDRALRARVDRHIDSILAHGNTAALRLLTSARDLLRQRGWAQLARENEQGRFCLSGALLHAAAGNRRVYGEALRAVGSRLGMVGCERGGFVCSCAVMRWNDAEGRTQNQVIAKIDEVIDAEISGAGS